MKIKFLTIGLFAATLAAVTFTSCTKTKEVEKIVYVDKYIDTSIKYETLTGSIATQTLDATKRYLIKGTASVDDGATLTIPAGTKLFGEKSTKGLLIVKKGGKLIANGTASNPIVFTSNQGKGEREQGDWGGLVILGKANVNQNNPAIEGVTPAVNYGTFQSTANDADNSGSLQYVRIEFAGIALTPNNETNSLTLGAVGSGTTIDYVQVTYGGDDGFEWFGGTVNAKHLVSLACWDDDFDADFGFSGKVQFAVSLRDPFNADQSGSNGFESDNDATGSTSTPKTSAVFSNVTILGASFDSAKAVSGNYQHAMHLRRNTELSLFNSVIAGFPLGLNLDGTLANYIGGLGVLDNNILVSIGNNKKAARPFLAGSVDAPATVGAYFLTTKNNKVFTSGTLSGTAASAYASAGIDPSLIMGYNTTAGVTGNYPKNPIFTSFTGLTQSGAAFTDPKVSGTFYTATTYKGAFGSTDWTDGWANFNVQNENY
ncbi:MAG: hypothetical protein HQ463_06585 [Bacteroidetes bacterium]|nr:hypothetical protein [Bacteroidota bacterium]